MGQRHQIYVVSKSKNEYAALGAFHHQWCYGHTAAYKAVKLAEAALKAKTNDYTLIGEPSKFEPYFLSDPREVDVLVKAIYGIAEDGRVSMVHNEAEYLIENNSIFPERGDNNDGACLLVIDNDEKQVRVCLFTPGHVEGKYGRKCKAWRAYSPSEYLAFYYNQTEQLEIDQTRMQAINAERPLVTQREFNKITKVARGLKLETVE